MKNKSIFSYLEPERFTSISYQIFFIIISACALLFFLYKPFVDFLPLEVHTKILPVTPETIKRWGKEPIHVKTGLVVTHVLKFDMLKDEFVMKILLWFDFDQNKISKETIDNFSFIKGKFTKKEVFYREIDHLIRAYYYVTLKFGETLNYHRFPIDDHFLYLRLTNETITPDQVIFDADPDNFIFLKKIIIPAWNITTLTVDPGYRIWPLDSQDPSQTIEETVVNFGMGFSKTDIRYIALIIFPMVLLFYLGLLSFAIRGILPMQAIKISSSISLISISGLLAYYFVIQTVAPNVGHFMITDFLLLFIFFSSLLAFLINGLSVEHLVIISPRTLARVKGLVVVVLHTLFITFWYYLSNIYLLR